MSEKRLGLNKFTSITITHNRDYNRLFTCTT